MKAVRTPDTNITLTLPGGTQDNDLPAQRALLYDESAGQTERDAQLGFISVWMPDEDEARRLEAGAAVELTIWGIPDGQGGKTQPPVAMGVTQAVVPERELIDRGHVDRALGHLYGQLAERAVRHVEVVRDALVEEVGDLHDAWDTERIAGAALPEPAEMAELWAASVEATKPKPAGYVDPDDPGERAKLEEEGPRS